MNELVVDASPPVHRAVTMFRDAIPAYNGQNLDQVRSGFEAVLGQLPIQDDTSITAATFGGVDGYWVQAAGASSERIGVLLHGGGYVMGSAAGYRAFAAEVSSATGARVFVAEYRLAPEHPFPAAVEDGSAVLSAAVAAVGPRASFAIGDSAGGGLVISSLSELHRAGSALPGCLVLVSALVDLTVSNSSFQDLASADPICSQRGTRRNAAFYLAGRGPDEAPTAFPMLSDLGWLPPSLLLVGGAEVLRDDSRNLAEKLKREGARVVYHEYDGMIHVWPLFASFLPEGRAALQEIGAFVRTQSVEKP